MLIERNGEEDRKTNITWKEAITLLRTKSEMGRGRRHVGVAFLPHLSHGCSHGVWEPEMGGPSEVPTKHLRGL